MRSGPSGNRPKSRLDASGSSRNASVVLRDEPNNGAAANSRQRRHGGKEIWE